ncbi:MAG TPA: type II secretion system protein [Candidatus Saccharimonadales bacterium]|nr:type II secretion system protein [Candidatus Saccharimonadales bacterium]
MNQTTNNQKGFTIIEVVLVLAIAGLIFLVVFLALPALQRSQRDTQRRSDASRAMSQLNSYQANNQGVVPTNQATLDAFKNGYLTNGGQQFNDPFTGSGYTFTYQTNLATLPTNNGEMFYYQNAVCSGAGLATGSGSRNVSIVVKVEQGGTFCMNN